MSCILLSISHKRARLLWNRTQHYWTQQEWGHGLFTDEWRFITQNDSRQVFIWREPGSCYHPSNVRKIDHFDGRGILVWGGIMLGSHTLLHVFNAVVSPHRAIGMRLLKPMWGFYVVLEIRTAFLWKITRDFWHCWWFSGIKGYSPYGLALRSLLNLIEHVWDGLGKAIARRNTLQRPSRH